MDASLEQFADHQPDRAQLTTQNNGLAETTIGLYKTECVCVGSPFRTRPIRTLANLENITSTWVCWYNASRLMHRLGRRPPTEAEAEYYARPRQQPRPAPVGMG